VDRYVLVFVWEPLRVAPVLSAQDWEAVCLVFEESLEFEGLFLVVG
jgi:hypothetical protein